MFGVLASSRRASTLCQDGESIPIDFICGTIPSHTHLVPAYIRLIASPFSAHSDRNAISKSWRETAVSYRVTQESCVPHLEVPTRLLVSLDKSTMRPGLAAVAAESIGLLESAVSIGNKAVLR